jgi:ATP-binding cassette subfamily B protein
MDIPVKQYFILLSSYLKPLWRWVVFLGVLLFGSIGLQLWTPQILRTFIDTAQAAGPMKTLFHIGMLYLGVTLLMQVLQIASTYITENIKWKSTNQLRNDLSHHCMKLDMMFHHRFTPGAMIERIDGDVDELSNFFSQFVLRILANVVLLFGVLVLLFREHWSVGLAFTLFSVFMLFGLGKTVQLATPYWEASRQAISELFGFIEEYLGGTEDLRASGAVAYVLRQLQQAIHALYLASRRAFIVGNMTWGSTNVFFAIATAIAFGMGAWLYTGHVITMGTIFMIFQYSNALHRPLEQLARELQNLQSASASIKRIEELFLERSLIIEPATPHRLAGGPLPVKFDHVTFGYSSKDPVLNDVNFSLDAGQILGLLGRTGGGKTTLTRLLFRLYDPQQGAVFLGEQNLRDIMLDELRQRVGKVTQDVQLFHASVRDNLTFFDDSFTDDRIIEAIELLGLKEWFSGLPRGLDTLLASGGKSLSAGEAQLLAFTRVFLKDPGLVILDEASSRLDPYTERLIEKAIDRLLKGRTAIIVAHHLATVQRADHILIIEEGQVIEYGRRILLAEDKHSRFSHLMQTSGLVEAVS